MNQAQVYCLVVLIVGMIVELIIIARNEIVLRQPNSNECPTISRCIWKLCQEHPWIAFVAGAMAWHFLGS